MNLKKRTMDEMISHFNRTVSAMDISRKDKMTLLGMITAIGFEYQQAADVVPVRHGRWEPLTMSTDNGMEVLWVHEKCGCERYEKSNYCPNCGALMDKDGDGE